LELPLSFEAISAIQRVICCCCFCGCRVELTFFGLDLGLFKTWWVLLFAVGFAVENCLGLVMRLNVTSYSFFFLLVFWFQELCAFWELVADLVLLLGGFFLPSRFSGDAR
jgi:hypothetical protein